MKKGSKTGKIGYIILSVIMVSVMFSGCDGGDAYSHMYDLSSTPAYSQPSARSSSVSSQSSMVVDQTERIELSDTAFSGTFKVGQPFQLKFSFKNISAVDIDGFSLITNDLKNFNLQDATGHPLYTPGLVQEIKWSEGGVVNVGETKDFVLTLVPTKVGNYKMLFTFDDANKNTILSGQTKNSAQITANILVTQ